MATPLPAVNKAKIEQEKIDVLFANYADKLEEGSIGYISHSQLPKDECQIASNHIHNLIDMQIMTFPVSGVP